MTIEKLKEMGLTDEQAKQVMDSLNGSFVPKDRFNEVNAELTQARDSLKGRDKQLKDLEKLSGDAKAFKEQVDQLQVQNDEATKKHQNEMKALKIDNAVERELMNAGAISPMAVKPFLHEHLTKAELDNDGVKGLSELISGLKTNEGTSFLFKAEEAAKQPAGNFTGISPGESADNSKLTDAFLEGLNTD